MWNFISIFENNTVFTNKKTNKFLLRLKSSCIKSVSSIYQIFWGINNCINNTQISIKSKFKELNFKGGFILSWY